MSVVCATTVLSASLGAAFIALIAVSVATSVVAAAFIEEPPRSPVPKPAVVLAGSWSLTFALAAAIAATSSPDLGLAGLLLAACELAAAALVWFIRSRRGGGGEDGDGGGGGRRRRRSPRPTAPAVPDSYWEYWERQLHR